MPSILADGLPDDAGFKAAFLVSAIGAIGAALSVLLIPGRPAVVLSGRTGALPAGQRP
jgi:hypothetical protein